MPSAHRRYAEWTIERIGIDAAAIGPSTAKLTALILESRPHPEQGYRACIGILRLARHDGAERLEAACARGLDIGARAYGRSNRSLSAVSIGVRPGQRQNANCCLIIRATLATALQPTASKAFGQC
jgi:transposase